MFSAMTDGIITTEMHGQAVRGSSHGWEGHGFLSVLPLASLRFCHELPVLVLDFIKPNNQFPSLRYNEEDTKKLKAYHSLHGNDWKKIGAMVARSSLSVALKYSQIGGSK